MDHAAAEREQGLARLAIALVLRDGVLHGLLRQAVLELERGDRQAVETQADIERAPGFVSAVGELPRDGEPVLRVEGFGLSIARRRGGVEEVEMKRPMVYTL